MLAGRGEDEARAGGPRGRLTRPERLSFSPRKRRRIPPASSAGVVRHAREVPGAPDLGLRRPPWRHGAAALAPFSSRGPARARLPEEDEGVLRSGPHESDPAADKTQGWTVFQIPPTPGRYRPPLERLLGCMPRRRGSPESHRAPGRWLPVKLTTLSQRVPPPPIARFLS